MPGTELVICEVCVCTLEVTIREEFGDEVVVPFSWRDETFLSDSKETVDHGIRLWK